VEKEKERKTLKREKEGHCKTKRLQSDASNPLKMQTQTNESQTNIQVILLEHSEMRISFFLSSHHQNNLDLDLYGGISTFSIFHICVAFL